MTLTKAADLHTRAYYSDSDTGSHLKGVIVLYESVIVLHKSVIIR